MSIKINTSFIPLPLYLYSTSLSHQQYIGKVKGLHLQIIFKGTVLVFKIYKRTVLFMKDWEIYMSTPFQNIMGQPLF